MALGETYSIDRVWAISEGERPIVAFLKLGSMSPSTISFFFKIVLTIRSPWQFHMNFRINFSISAKKAAWILGQISLNPQSTLGSIAIFISSLPIHGHGISFHSVT